jgi:cytochrome P450
VRTRTEPTSFVPIIESLADELVDDLADERSVDVVLRWLESPTQAALRVTPNKLTSTGTRSRPARSVPLELGSANRDADVFPSPLRFDPGRNLARRHVAFGRGIHTCVGA